MRLPQTLTQCFSFLLIFMLLLPAALAQNARKPGLIRDTDIAEGKETAEDTSVKEPNPILAKQNISIGNSYFKQKNYAAAISRYLEALEYEKDSLPAYEALSRAYEKNGNMAKSIQTLKLLIEKHPESPKIPKFRQRLSQLEKKAR